MPRTIDLIQRLPSELSLRCICIALPPDKNYASQLFEFASVSRRWQSFVISAALLWTEIHIMRLENDLMAQIATFVHFSGIAPLHITIWDELDAAWTDIVTILFSHSSRIYKITFNRPRHTHGHQVDPFILIDQFGELPNLQELSLDTYTRNIRQLEINNISPRLLILSRVHFGLGLNDVAT